MSQVSATGTGYSVSGVTVPFTLAAGASKSFNVVFAPTTSGSPTGTLTVTSDASNPSLTVSLSGTAASVGALAATTTPLSFGSVTVNQNKTLSETITNNGGSTVTVSQVSATGTGLQRERRHRTLHPGSRRDQIIQRCVRSNYRWHTRLEH